ncbi:DUF914 domain membrane protein [Metarhizium album ARSEF 1941]|uniref:DUF914 domain membrane protein n=1 Tax=Metarhizium album (strain ARSEF 1941) TaxID=1081103 RepID=A0A0B2X7S2_METAS|nr:DUF914 domain membrane protein [Metarhizium album ARSEF 1941]KHO01331.1 DUF914 domain membrane protein [Metarhizium album ARSEF 1941]
MTIANDQPEGMVSNKSGLTTHSAGVSSGHDGLDSSDRGSRAAPDSETSFETAEATQGLYLLESKSVHWWSYLATADFWIVVAIGQILALCITATNTFTTFLQREKFNAPAFQTLFNYVFLAIIFNGIFFLRDGPRAWGYVAYHDGWKYLIMAFLDVEGNYFTVLAYAYTNILSAQLLNFWSIVCVVIISFVLLKVRYKPFQVIGILVCCGGMGILLGSDYIVQRDSGVSGGESRLKGDLFGLLGATLYGTSNVLEEWLVSKAPMHHVLAFMGLWGMIINGTQAAIFDRDTIAGSAWSGRVGGYLAGYTLCLTLFYTLAPLILRMGSAAFFDISLLTANFWGVIIGIHVFGLSIHFLYPIAFVCIIIGLTIYFLSGSVLGDSKKPWLGDNQEDGVAGIGTAKLRAINAARMASVEAEYGTPAATNTLISARIHAIFGKKI